MGDDPEAVRDGFRDGLPLTGKGPVGEPEDRPGEPAQVGVEPVVRHMAVHDPPTGARWGRVRGAGRQEVRTDAASRPLQEGFGAFA